MKKLFMVIVMILTLLFSITTSCKKDQSPILDAGSVSKIYGTSATLSGNISDEGSDQVTLRGFVWSTTENPSLETNLGKLECGSGSGSFIGVLTNLSPATTYYVKSFATNDVGTSYGNQSSFKTLGEACPGLSQVSDIEGNIYNTICIANKCWMAENLKTTKYNDNTDIPNVTINSEWKVQTEGAYSVYNNEESNKDIYGALYNYYAVETGKLCPSGWHVPTDNEWKELEGTVDSEYSVGNVVWDNEAWRGSDSGKNLKTPDIWLSSESQQGLDTYGFSALPGGCREVETGEFQRIEEWGLWWSDKNDTETNVFRRYLGNQNDNIARFPSAPESGYSVRCVKD
jgi:uncharacterized protein (TIGR02145 family)